MTSTLEQIDLERLLDDAPKCENPNCEAAATHSIRTSCCGETRIACQPCAAAALRHLDYLVWTGLAIQCTYCDARIPNRKAPDWLKVDPL